jgi:hypothetical protein
MEHRGLDFRGALLWLADYYAVQLTDRPLTPAERAAYGRKRAAAQREAAVLVEWKSSMLTALRNARDAYLHTYHRGVRYVMKNGLDSPAGTLAADIVELYEERYRDLDRRIEHVESAPYAELLPFFRAQSQRAA